MGCFGYICRGCGTQIVGDSLSGGEETVMIHVRDGVEQGRTVGHYDEYGRVVEDGVFRNDEEGNPNNHKRICESEFGLETSILVVESKRYIEEMGRDATLEEFIEYRNSVDTVPACEVTTVQKYIEYMDKRVAEIGLEYKSRPEPRVVATSGIVAWHKKCYDEATEEEQCDLTPSEQDPDQSWGRVREEYR